MWIKIKEQLINLNHFESMRWDESHDGDIVSLHLHPCVRHSGKLQFNWKVKTTDGKRDDRAIADLDVVHRQITKATHTMHRIFKHDLADNNLDKYPSHKRVGRKGRVKRADDKRLMDNKEHSMNPNAEFIGE